MEKSYSKEEFDAMKKLKAEFEEAGQGHQFTIGTIQRRLRLGRVRALDIFVDLQKERSEQE